MATVEDEKVESEFNEKADPDPDLVARADAEGVTIEEMARREAAGEVEKPTPPMQMPLPGTAENISLSAGGQKPTSSEARLLGGSMPLEGQFAKGDVVMLLVEAKVGAVEFIDATDEWGKVQRTSRRHKLRMLSVKRFGE